MKSHYIAVGCDPGLKNFGLSIVKIKKGKTKILHSAMLQNMVTDLKENVIEQQQKFLKEIKPLLKQHKPTLLVIERFQVRGRFGGSIAECISFMIGSLVYLCRILKIDVKLVVASSWKNQFQRVLKKTLQSLYIHLRPLPPHLDDSILQATYGLNPTYTDWQILPLRKLRDDFQSRKNSTKVNRKR